MDERLAGFRLAVERSARIEAAQRRRLDRRARAVDDAIARQADVARTALWKAELRDAVERVRERR